MKTVTKKTVQSDYPAGVVAIYDNRGITADRYTVIYAPERDRGGYGSLVWQYVGMSSEPFHPQGFGQHGETTHSGYVKHGAAGDKRIKFADLPTDCQKLVRQDLKAS